MPFLSFLARNATWLGGAFLLCFFSSFGQTFFIALSNGAIRDEFSLTHGEFGLIYMSATLASAATLPFLGRVLDRFPARVVGAGTIVCLAGATLLIASATMLPVLVISIYLLRLFGQGMMTQTALTSTGRWFAANRGRAISLVVLGNQTGEGTLPLIFVTATALLGWRGSWMAGTAVLLLVALPLIVFLLRRERDPQSDRPSSGAASVADATVSEVLKRPSFYGLLLGVLAPPFIGTTIYFHQVYLTELRGWPLESFALGFTVSAATTVVFALVAGWLVDRFSAVRLLPFFLLPLTCACLVAANVEAEAAIFGFMVLLGISNGFSSTLLGAIWPEIYGVKNLGQIRSVVVAAMVFATAIGPGLTGTLIDLAVPYPAQINAMALYCLAAVALMTVLARHLRHPRAVQDAQISAPMRPIDRVGRSSRG